ncbi:hypothetical protein AnigIFM63604_000556 [Aspergillus niger]|uniref:Uncharacterized protein n=1 Tax=Aspergillus niger TaxID=5061 RepID=A0A9W6ECZ6_ASPNG|nr:hypothetical protein AnigIFM63604_000556 [Aspergillus niger]
MHNFSEEFLARPEYQVIKAFVQNPDVSPAEAVQRLLRVREVLHWEGREPPTDIDGTHTWIAMVTVVDLVSLTPAAQQHKFIEFIDHLQRTKVIDPVSGEEPTAVDMKLWTELPYLGVDDDPRREYPPSELQEWENRNAFMAQLTAKADHLGHTIDASLYARYGRAEKRLRSVIRWWKRLQRMWENCQVRRTFGEAENPSPRQRFTMKKWYHWRNGLKAAQLQFPRASTQEMIQKALTEIEKAERGE